MITSHHTRLFFALLLGLAAAPASAQSPDGNQSPAVTFTAAPTSGQAPLTVNFDATTADDPDGWFASRSWDFGDGARAWGPEVSHTYQQEGTYTVTLTGTDNDGASAVATETIVVGMVVSVTLAWDPSADERVAVYEVGIGTTAGSYPERWVVAAGTEQHTVQLVPGEYVAAVRACTAEQVLCSPWSEELQFQVRGEGIPAPAAPTIIHISVGVAQ